MSEKLEKNEFFLKGVIPPKRTTPEAIDEAIRNLREFLQRFPFLGEEVTREREKRLSEDGRNIHH
jgi:hypothetical protein